MLSATRNGNTTRGRKAGGADDSHTRSGRIRGQPGITLWADLPGVTKDKLEVKVHDGNLYIEAEAVVPTAAGLRIQHAEIREPRFPWAFALSPDFDTSEIDANLQDGVLKLIIPRRDEARPRRIEVRTS